MAIFIFFSGENSSAVVKEKDGIIISSVYCYDERQEIHITCILSNKSSYPVFYGNTGSSNAFCVDLLDEAGNPIAKNLDWARAFRQKGTDLYDEPRSFIVDVIKPGEQRDFKFTLRDAFGEKMALGRTLVILWENKWVWEGYNVAGGKNADGTVSPAHTIENHFPAGWETSISLPMPQKDGDETLPPAIDSKNTPPQPVYPALKSNVIKPRPTGASATADSSTNATPLWWTLLIFPVTFIVWLVSRRKKKK